MPRKKQAKKAGRDEDDASMPSDFEYVTDDEAADSDNSSEDAEHERRESSEDSDADDGDDDVGGFEDSEGATDAGTEDSGSDDESSSRGAGDFEDGIIEMEPLTEEELQLLVLKMKEERDVDIALKLIVSVFRIERRNAPMPPIQFSRSVKEAAELLYDAFEILKTAPTKADETIPKYYKVFWKEVGAYLMSVSSPHHPLATALLISLDEQIMRSIWIIRKPRLIESLWVKLWTCAMAHAQPDFCPPVLAGFIKTFDESNKKSKLLIPILKKTIAVVYRHFAVRKVPNKVVETAKYLSSHIAAILYGLCLRGQAREVYTSVALALKYLITQVGQYTTLLSRPTSGNAQTAKKTKVTLSQLHDKVISWGTLTLIGTTLSLMVLEKSGDEVFEPSTSRFGEVLLAILFSLLRIQKSKVTYIPFHMKVLGLCLALCKCTQLYCPLGSSICDFGDCISVCIDGQKSGKLAKKQTHLTKPADLSSSLILPDDQIAHSTFHENIVFAFKDVLTDYLCHLAHHPAFPEVTHILMSTANKKFKNCPSLAKIIKSLLPVVEETAAQIQELRKPLRQKTFVNKESTLHIIPKNLYGDLNLVRFASNRSVNNAIFIF